jgi:rod shape-determining protein MreC
VLTSGGDQIFPKGLPVGTVGEVKRGGEFLQVTVTPATALNHLEEVLVITKKQEREPQAAGASPVRAADILAQRLPSVPDKPEQPTTGSVQPSGTGTVGTSQPKPVAPMQGQTQQSVPSRTTATQATPIQTKPSQPKPFASGTETSPGGTAGTGAVGTSQPKLVSPIQGQTQPSVPSRTTATQATPTQTKPQPLVSGTGTSPKGATGKAPKPAAPAPSAPAKPDATTTQQPGQTDTGDTPQ